MSLDVNLCYDLHSHTTFSDGTLSPAQLIDRARAQGVDVLALTDHDTTDGLEEAHAAARARGVSLIDGVEISVTWDKRTVHIVGLRIDRTNRELQAGLARLREFRLWRAQEIDRRLARHRIGNMLEGARERAKGAIISRTHFAHELVARGHAADVRDAFKHFLTSGNPGYVPGAWTTLEEAVGWIRDAGGAAVIAHPGRYRLTATRLRRLIHEFKNAGGSAIEVLSGSHSPNETAHMARVANEHELLASVGSDYHGPEKPWVELGRLPSLPDDCVAVWQSWCS